MNTKSKNLADVTDIKYVDPVSFNKISVGDRVTVTAPTGAVVDLKVTSIGEDESMVLGPLNDESHFRPLASKNSIVLAHEFRGKGSGFRAGPKDIVTVTDKSGHKIKMRVDLILGDEFLVLDNPTNTKPMGLINKLKFAWKIAQR